MLMTIEEEKHEGDNTQLMISQKVKMTEKEIISAEVDSEEDVEHIDGLMLNGVIDEDKDEQTTHYRMRRSVVPP